MFNFCEGEGKGFKGPAAVTEHDCCKTDVLKSAYQEKESLSTLVFLLPSDIQVMCIS